MNARETFEKLGYKGLENRVDPTYCKKDDPWTWINFLQQWSCDFNATWFRL